MNSNEEAVFGYGHPSLRAMGLTSMKPMLACAENGLDCTIESLAAETRNGASTNETYY
jgi:hypothetical protein